MDNNVGNFIFYTYPPLNPDLSINLTWFNEWIEEDLSHKSWDLISVGPMRLTQYRTKTFECKREVFY